MSEEHNPLSTIRDTFAPMHTNATEAAKCAICGKPTYQVVSGKLEDDTEAWFVPLCVDCHQKQQTKEGVGDGG